MAVLTVVTSDRTGQVFTLAAAAGGGDSFPNTGKEIVQITNGGVGSVTLTIPVTATPDGLAVASRTVAVAAGATKVIGPFPTGTYNDVNSRVNLTYSGVTTVTVGVLAPGS